MTTTEPRIAPTAIEPYVAAVRALLSSLPAEERDELVDDVTAHLTELAAEPGPPLAERLGPPSRYAAEFVASAGVAVPPAGASTSTLSSWLERANVQSTRERWHELRPAWLAVRPFFAVAGLLHVLDINSFSNDAFGPLIVVAVLGALAVPASQRLGATRGALDRAVTIGAIVAALVVAAALDDGPSVIYTEGGQPAFDGVYRDDEGLPVTNIWAYDSGGEPVDVFLFDQLGRPLELRAFDAFDPTTNDELRTEVRIDPAGRPVPNLYPRRQERVRWDETTGSERTTEDSAPAISTPQVETDDRSSATTTTSTTAATTTTPTTAAAPPPAPAPAP